MCDPRPGPRCSDHTLASVASGRATLAALDDAIAHGDNTAAQKAGLARLAARARHDLRVDEFLNTASGRTILTNLVHGDDPFTDLRGKAATRSRADVDAVLADVDALLAGYTDEQRRDWLTARLRTADRVNATRRAALHAEQDGDHRGAVFIERFGPEARWLARTGLRNDDRLVVDPDTTYAAAVTTDTGDTRGTLRDEYVHAARLLPTGDGGHTLTPTTGTTFHVRVHPDDTVDIGTVDPDGTVDYSVDAEYDYVVTAVEHATGKTPDDHTVTVVRDTDGTPVAVKITGVTEDYEPDGPDNWRDDAY